jgi:hypothetical protein
MTLDKQKLIKGYNMQVTDEMIQVAEHAYHVAIGYSKRLGNNEAMKSALEAVFSLIEKESADNAQCDCPDILKQIDGHCTYCGKQNIPKQSPKEQPDNEGWIQTNGVQPNLNTRKIELKFDDGDVATGDIWEDWLWDRVIAYRILPNQTPEKEKSKALWGESIMGRNEYKEAQRAENHRLNQAITNEDWTLLSTKKAEKEKIPTLRDFIVNTIPDTELIFEISAYLDKYMMEKG